MKPAPQGWLPFFCLLLAMILWAGSFVALKLAFRAYDPVFVLFARMAIASLCSLVLIRRFGGVRFRTGDLKFMAFMTVCEPCLYFLFEARAIENTTASQAAMITAMLPLLVAVAARVFLKERTTAKTAAGFALAIAGTIWLSLYGEPDAGAPNPVLGNFMEFMAMVCATGYTIALKRLSSRYHPFFLTMLQAFAGSLFFLPFLLARQSALPAHFDVTAALSIFYLAVPITLGAYGLYNYGVSKIPASQATAFANLIPVFAVLLGWLVLGEQFTRMQYAASALVLAGILLSQSKTGQGESLGDEACASKASV
ncbi:MAG: DMT family transporter [Syntrophobacteraceae bacterium]|nr:DMT family transporter [Desulfobacteraceae bacterium]